MPYLKKNVYGNMITIMVFLHMVNLFIEIMQLSPSMVWMDCIYYYLLCIKLQTQNKY